MNWEAALYSFLILSIMLATVTASVAFNNWLERRFGLGYAAFAAALQMLALTSLAIGIICSEKPWS